VADRIFSTHILRPAEAPQQEDSIRYAFNGTSVSIHTIMNALKIKGVDSTSGKDLAHLYTNDDYRVIARSAAVSEKQMPSLKGVGLKDALEICEERKLKVTIAGRGKVAMQSIDPGSAIRDGQTIHLQLN